MSNSTGRESDKVMLRLPDGMRDMLKDLADQNQRSMNAEIVFALSRHLSTSHGGEGVEDLLDQIESALHAVNKLREIDLQKESSEARKDMLHRIALEEIESSKSKKL